eukprot:gene3165-3443_t
MLDSGSHAKKRRLDEVEEELMTFLEERLALCGAAVGPGRAVSYCRIQADKNYAFVEVRSAEEATNAIAMDGLMFKEGIHLKIKRPSKFEPEVALMLGPQMPDPSIDLAALGIAKNEERMGPEVPGRYERNWNTIYVGNLPHDWSEPQVKYFKLMVDRESGKSRGFCFCEFAEEAATANALENLNGMSYQGRQLVVNRAMEHKAQQHHQQQAAAGRGVAGQASNTQAGIVQQQQQLGMGAVQGGIATGMQPGLGAMAGAGVMPGAGSIGMGMGTMQGAAMPGMQMVTNGQMGGAMGALGMGTGVTGMAGMNVMPGLNAGVAGMGGMAGMAGMQAQGVGMGMGMGGMLAWSLTLFILLWKPKRERAIGTMRDLLYICLMFVALKLDGLAPYSWNIVFLIPWMWFATLLLGAIVTAGVIFVAYACMDLRELSLPGGFLLLLLSAASQLPGFVYLSRYLDGDVTIGYQQILLPQVVSWTAMWISGLIICYGLYKKEQLRASLAAAGQVWTRHESAARELMSLELEDMQQHVDKMSNDELAQVAMRMMAGKVQPQQLLRVGSTLYKAMSFSGQASLAPAAVMKQFDGDGTAPLGRVADASDAMEAAPHQYSSAAMGPDEAVAEGAVCVSVQVVLRTQQPAEPGSLPDADGKPSSGSSVNSDTSTPKA